MWCSEDRWLLNDALQTDDIEERQPYTGKLTDYYTNAFLLFPSHMPIAMGIQNELEGMTINAFGGVRFGGVKKHCDPDPRKILHFIYINAFGVGDYVVFTRIPFSRRYT